MKIPMHDVCVYTHEYIGGVVILKHGLNSFLSVHCALSVFV